MLKIKPILVMIFIFTFYYFLTISIPPFWEDHSFHQRFIQTSSLTHLKQTFRIGNENIFYLERPVLGLYFQATFALFKYDFFWHQLTKIIFTAVSSLLLFTLVRKYLKSENYAFLITLFTYLSYPFFSSFLQYDNPFVFSEFFKIAALFFLLQDITAKRTSYLNQFLVLLFSILAFRSYNQAWSIVGVIIIFTTLYNYQLLKRYAVLFSALILYNFPINIISILTKKASYSDPSAYGSSFSGFFYTTFKPFYTPFHIPESLYYASLTDVLAFFGLLAILILSVLFALKYYETKTRRTRIFTRKNDNDNTLAVLSTVWIICELPLWYLAPDPNVRYLSGIMTPLFILIFTGIQRIHTSLLNHYKKSFVIVITILLIGLLFTNILYAYLFRITWGSAFVGYAKVNDYLEETRTRNAYVLYYAGTVARLLFPLDKQNDNYYFKQDVIYKKGSVEDFSEANIKQLKKKYNEVYVIKSKSAFGNSEYPTVPIENYKNLKKIQVIRGINGDTIDTTTEWLTAKLGINYNAYTFTIYKAV